MFNYFKHYFKKIFFKKKYSRIVQKQGTVGSRIWAVGRWAAVYCPSSAERGSPIYPVNLHSKEAADRSRCDRSSATYGPVPGGNS